MSMALSGLKWRATITAAEAAVPDELTKLIPGARAIELAGIAIDDSINLNKWALKAEELDKVAEQMMTGGIQLRVNHGDKVSDVIGKVIEAKRDGNKVIFKARMCTANPDVLLPIITRAVDHVSIQADAQTSSCSECGQSMYPFKTCECENGHQVISDVRVRELSIVAEPAYESTEFIPVGFAACVNKTLEDRIMAQDEKKSEEKKSEEFTKPNAAEEKKLAEKLAETYGELAEQRKMLSEMKAELAEMRKARKAEEEERKAEEKKAEQQEEEETKDDGEDETVAPDDKKAKKASAPVGKSASKVADPHAPTEPSIGTDGLFRPNNPNLAQAACDDIMRFAAKRGITPLPTAMDPGIFKEMTEGAEQEKQ